jgi:hypothetical protein
MSATKAKLKPTKVKPAPVRAPAPVATNEPVVARLFGGDFWKPFAGLPSETCWLWPGRPNAQGYGRCCRDRMVCLAHRIAWIVARGEIPDGLCVLHRCDVRMCVNPAHLFLGDRGDNARDMSAKGRAFLQQHPEQARRGSRHHLVENPELAVRGSEHGMALLSEPEVLAMRVRAAVGEPKEALAAAFRVSPSTVWMATHGHTWKHVGGPIIGRRGKGAGS